MPIPIPNPERLLGEIIDPPTEQEDAGEERDKESTAENAPAVQAEDLPDTDQASRNGTTDSEDRPP